MRVSLYGAARSVTGSRNLIEVLGLRLLLDCGLFQGRREEAVRRNLDMDFDLKSLGAVLLSHAHIDHSAPLPVLPREGFSGKVHATSATADSVGIMLDDSARVRQIDCRYVNKKKRRHGKTCVRPFYDKTDVRKIMRRFEGERLGDQYRGSTHEI